MPRFAASALAAVLVLGATACTAQEPPGPATEAEVGSGHLAPSFAPTASPSTRAHRRVERARRAAASRSPSRPARSGTPGRPAGSGAAPASPAGPAGTGTASVQDRAGDVAGGFGAPSYVDLTGARLEADGGSYVLRVAVAGGLPRRQPASGKTMNVASFFDVDGDGSIDYEVWATLADDGWDGSYRYPDGARFGDDSGVSARPVGHRLVVRFPRSLLGPARSFQWAVGSEWGSYEQVSTGTTASDHAPDNGAAGFPD